MEFRKYLVQKVLLFPVLGAILDSHNVGPWQHICIPGYNYEHNKYIMPKPTCCWWMSHISEPHFRLYISVHFRNLFVSDIALPVKTDNRKLRQQHYSDPVPTKTWKQSMKMSVAFNQEIQTGTQLFADFLKCSSGFHATMLTFPAEMCESKCSSAHRWYLSVWSNVKVTMNKDVKTCSSSIVVKIGSIYVS